MYYFLRNFWVYFFIIHEAKQIFGQKDDVIDSISLEISVYGRKQIYDFMKIKAGLRPEDLLTYDSMQQIMVYFYISGIAKSGSRPRRGDKHFLRSHNF